MNQEELDKSLLEVLALDYHGDDRGQKVGDLLERGANPDVFVAGGGMQLSECALSRAVQASCQESIGHLIGHGAVPVWHMDPRRPKILDIETRCGMPIDPLVIVCEQLAFNMDTFGRLIRTPGALIIEENFGWGEAVFMQLLQAYPEHIKTADSRMGSPALDAFVLSLANMGVFDRMTPGSLQCAARVMVAGFAAMPQGQDALARMGRGEFSGLPACDWEWWQDCPDLATAVQRQSMVALADRSKQAMEAETPVPKRVRQAVGRL